MKKKCVVDGCDGKVDAKGMCSSHYSRNKRYGDPNAGRETFNGEPHKWLLEHLEAENDECLIWPFGKHSFGYGELFIDGEKEYVHEIVTTIKLGPKPSRKHQVRHLCGNGLVGCISDRHLTWGTRSENESDKVCHGTSNRGSRHGKSILTEQDVLEIAAKITGGMSNSNLANRYGVHVSTISSIRNGYRWAWLTGIKLSPLEQQL